MALFEWIVVLFCCLIAAGVFPILVATRFCPAPPDDPGNHGKRKVLVWMGVISDSTAAVFTGALLGIPRWPALIVGLLFFTGKLGLAEVWGQRLHPGPVEQRTEEEARASDEQLRARFQELRSTSGGTILKRGFAKWSGFALLNLFVLILLLLPFRLWLGG